MSRGSTTNEALSVRSETSLLPRSARRTDETCRLQEFDPRLGQVFLLNGEWEQLATFQTDLAATIATAG
jgi:hypothetical protein